MLVSEVIEAAAKAPKKADKIKILKDNETWAVKDVLRGMYDESVVWNLPPGEPPYQPTEAHNAPANLQRENTKFAYLVSGGKGDSLPAVKRESIFIGMLEGVHPDDAKILIKMINKEKMKGITRNVINEAFPALLRDEQ
jgi:hypothetical protein